MQLTVPQRTVPDQQSFPVEPEGVNRWLTKLDPIRSTSDAMEVYRGLRHSNRLHNDLTRRRAVVACFVPTLTDLHNSLLEICQAQPAPLTDEFQRSAQLLDGLLREEAFAFKILLADSPQPRGEDVRCAMHALAKQAHARIHAYKTIPESLLRDAHQLFGLAEEFSLVDTKVDEEKRSTSEHYKSILLLTLADCQQHRVRQIQPLIEFLQEHAAGLRIRNKAPADASRPDHFAVHLKHGSRPVPATALLSESTKYVRWLNLTPVLKRIDVQLARSRSQDTPVLGGEALDRQALVRLRIALAKSRQRVLQRTISHAPKIVMFGHKPISSHMALSVAKAQGQSRSVDSDGESLAAAYEAMSKVSDVMKEDAKARWMMINQSSQGAALYNANCRAGEVQVGELVSIGAEDGHLSLHTSGRSNAMIGVVRWVSAGEGSAIHAGVEYLAKGVLPIGIVRAYNEEAVVENAMIIACKVKGKVMQTILLPAFIYQPGDQLSVSLNDKTRKVKLNKPLQNNGLFSHYSMQDT